MSKSLLRITDEDEFDVKSVTDCGKWNAFFLPVLELSCFWLLLMILDFGCEHPKGFQKQQTNNTAPGNVKFLFENDTLTATRYYLCHHMACPKLGIDSS